MRKVFRNIFSNENINCNRQIEVDIIRGLAIFFMILVHTSGQFLNESGSKTLFANTVDFFGCIPAAPVFMFVMGIGFVYSKNQDGLYLIKRGIQIFALGYLLNFLRGFLPVAIGSRLGYYSLTEGGMPWFYYLVEVDILQFAGLAMIFIGFLKKIRLNIWFYPVIAIIVGFVSPYLWKLNTGIAKIDVLLATLFGGYSYTFHPFFSWIFYPLFGTFFGWLLIKVKDKNKFYKYTIYISSMSLAGGLLYYAFNKKIDLGIVVGNIYNYFQHGIVSNWIFVSFVILWLSVWYFVTSVIPQVIKNKLMFWSKNVTSIYIVSWIILGWSSALFVEELNLKETIIAMLIVLVATDRIVDVYVKIKNRDINANLTVQKPE